MTENTVRRISVPCRMMLAGTAGVTGNRLRSTSAPGQPIQCSDLHNAVKVSTSSFRMMRTLSGR